ncbi:MAG: proton-conducting transporter membrane subunit [Candidatus Bipolaricaulota bacterium]|nr:proton-conducting transporter membrane subunit [Candidatus Bipolaricaulota bacterium]
MVSILLIAFVGAGGTCLVGRGNPRFRGLVASLVAFLPLIILAFLYGRVISIDYASVPFLDIGLSLRLTPLSWFFGIAIAALGGLAIVFSISYMQGKERLNYYYSMMLLVNASMLGIVLSGDFLSFYIFWEIMSWSTYLLISYRGKQALGAGLKYIIMSIIGSSAMLLAIGSLYISYGTLEIPSLATALQGASAWYALFVLLMFTIAFGIKNAILPLHTWLPDAHSEAVSPFSAILSGILVRMGLYGLFLLMFSVLGLNTLNRLSYGAISFNLVLSWVGALTILFPIFIAVLQDDAKRLIAWSSIGHGGYMILGIGVATTLGIAGGLFHALNYAICVALLFLAVGAVEYRTGTRDLNKLGGLMKRMPITFTGALIGSMGLIGIPLTNGFISKWLIYKTLILSRYPFLAFAALIGTWGTVLYGYKLVHNVFLGQLPEQYKEIEEVPWTMRVPMIVLSGFVVLFGVLPGIPLKAISVIQTHLGMTRLETSLFGMPKAIGELNTLNIFFALLVAGLIAYAAFSASRRSRRVSQYDNYAAGARVPVGGYQHSVRFYDQADRIIRPYLRDRIDDFYGWIATQSTAFFEQLRKIYTGNINTYATWIVLFVAVLIFMGLLGWRI